MQEETRSNKNKQYIRSNKNTRFDTRDQYKNAFKYNIMQVQFNSIFKNRQEKVKPIEHGRVTR